jgi:RAB protein geranylgeranyltransferase component A
MFSQFEVVKITEPITAFIKGSDTKTYPKGTTATILSLFEDVCIKIHDEADTFLKKVGPEVLVEYDQIEAYEWPVEFTK